MEARCAEFGDSFDLWQKNLGGVALGKRADGYYAATIGGVTLSIPRQVAKTFIVMRIAFALCTLYPNLTVIWTAHRQRTATATFLKLKALASRKAAQKYVDKRDIRSANGEQEIKFRNGSRILFGAREQGFGRGFDEVDVLVFDEAQILTEKALEDMVAATNQSRFPAGALLFYMGTPPRPIDPGGVFTQRRAEALAFKADGEAFGAPTVGEDAFYVECSADPNVGKPNGPALDDINQVAIGNPSYPERTPLVSILRLRKNLSSDEGWRREGLGVWDDPHDASLAGINPANWERQAAPKARYTGTLSIGIDMEPDRSSVSLAWVAARDGEDGLLGRLIDRRQGSQWVVDRLMELVKKYSPAAVVIDPHGSASTLIAEIERAGVQLTQVNFAEYKQACGNLHDLVDQGDLWHVDQPILNAAVAGSTAQIMPSGGWKWKPRGDVSISPLKALTLALHGATSAEAANPVNNVW